MLYLSRQPSHSYPILLSYLVFIPFCLEYRLPIMLIKWFQCFFWDSVYAFVTFNTLLPPDGMLEPSSQNTQIHGTSEHIQAAFIFWLSVFQDTIFAILIIYNIHLISNKLKGNFKLHQKHGELKRRDCENRLCHSVTFIRLSLGHCQPLMFQLASAETHLTRGNLPWDA